MMKKLISVVMATSIGTSLVGCSLTRPPNIDLGVMTEVPGYGNDGKAPNYHQDDDSGPHRVFTDYEHPQYSELEQHSTLNSVPSSPESQEPAEFSPSLSVNENGSQLEEEAEKRLKSSSYDFECENDLFRFRDGWFTVQSNTESFSDDEYTYMAGTSVVITDGNLECKKDLGEVAYYDISVIATDSSEEHSMTNSTYYNPQYSDFWKEQKEEDFLGNIWDEAEDGPFTVGGKLPIMMGMNGNVYSEKPEDIFLVQLTVHYPDGSSDISRAKIVPTRKR